MLEIANEDRFTDIVEGGFDAGMRLGESLERDMIAVRIGPDIRGAVVGCTVLFREHAEAASIRAISPTTAASAAAFPTASLYRWEFEKDGEEIEYRRTRAADPRRGPADRPGGASTAPASPSLRALCACAARRRKADPRAGGLVPALRGLLRLLSEPPADAPGAAGVCGFLQGGRLVTLPVVGRVGTRSFDRIHLAKVGAAPHLPAGILSP